MSSCSNTIVADEPATIAAKILVEASQNPLLSNPKQPAKPPQARVGYGPFYLSLLNCATAKFWGHLRSGMACIDVAIGVSPFVDGHKILLAARVRSI